MNIYVIDGQGGRLGQRLVEGIRRVCPGASVHAVGLNASATERMIKGGAVGAATGENAVLYACRRADILSGPVGIAIADSMMGEVSPKVANAVAESLAYRVLVPMNLCDTYISGTAGLTSETLITDALEHIRRLAEARDKLCGEEVPPAE